MYFAALIVILLITFLIWNLTKNTIYRIIWIVFLIVLAIVFYLIHTYRVFKEDEDEKERHTLHEFDEDVWIQQKT